MTLPYKTEFGESEVDVKEEKRKFFPLWILQDREPAGLVVLWVRAARGSMCLEVQFPEPDFKYMAPGNERRVQRMRVVEWGSMQVRRELRAYISVQISAFSFSPALHGQWRWGVKGSTRHRGVIQYKSLHIRCIYTCIITTKWPGGDSGKSRPCFQSIRALQNLTGSSHHQKLLRGTLSRWDLWSIQLHWCPNNWSYKSSFYSVHLGRWIQSQWKIQLNSNTGQISSEP